MRKITLIYTIFMAIISVHSQQESQFTQYMYNTISVNSAYAGSRDIMSVFGMYRTQWVGIDGAPDTGVFSVDAPITERIGVGLSFANDRISIASESDLSADFSYRIPIVLGENNYYLAFGLKATAHILNVDYGKLRLRYTDPILDPNNNINSRFSPNVGAGFYFYSQKLYAGLSVPNILETKIYDNDVQSTAKERMHGYLIAGYVVEGIHEDIKFKPAILTKVVQGAPIQMDITANFMFQEKFIVGLAYRWTSALSTLAGFQVNNNWFIGYAYDAETTKLTKYNSGTHEIFLRYDFTPLGNNKRIVSPRFF